ncbi:MAG: SDR family oxidoreductase [Phycisphaerae bacterium]|nr:SDR family oxidoreductase [Phycisphaerae bacterium]
MDKYLVTGGAGFIGSNICRRLVSEGCFVRVVDNLITGKRRNLEDILDRIDFVEADMGDPQVAAAVMKDIDVVLHQGAVPSVPKSVADPATTHRHCVDATFTLLLAARDAAVKRFVYAASSSAYGDSPTLPKIETMPVNPLSPYAVAKLVGEHYSRVFCSVFGLETIALRYFNVFGPYQDPTSQYAAAIPAFVTSILDGISPVVYGDGEQSRDFTYIDNVVEANLLAARAGTTRGEVVNIACGDRITINAIVQLINDILGTHVAPRYEPGRSGDVKHSLADIRLARDLIGYTPIVTFQEGLSKAVDWYRDNL